jgi:zinc transport system ATP-binding protein
LSDITVAYGENKILEGVALKVEGGEFLGLIGPNGAGKTTLLKVIIGLIKPSRGTVRVFGAEVSKAEGLHLRAGIGYVPQHIALQGQNFPATVSEIVSTGRVSSNNMFKRLSHDDYDRVEDALRTADVHDLRNRSIGELSGGQTQRVFIARALAGEPRLLLLDEPTSEVDVASQLSFYNLLEKLNKEQGLTIIIASHDIGTISRHCTSVACINKQIYFHGDPKGFFQGDAFLRAYGYPLGFCFTTIIRCDVIEIGSRPTIL